jgi:multidrug efflux pump subunit AcrB
VAVACLAFSLVESLLILPAHLAHGRARNGPSPLAPWDRLQGRFAAGLERFVHGPYRRALRAALRERTLTLAAGFFVFAATLGAVVGGWPTT